MEPKIDVNNTNVEQVISELLKQNTDLRFQLSVLQVQLKEHDHQAMIEKQMAESQIITPELAEILSKLDIK